MCTGGGLEEMVVSSVPVHNKVLLYFCDLFSFCSYLFVRRLHCMAILDVNVVVVDFSDVADVVDIVDVVNGVIVDVEVEIDWGTVCMTIPDSHFVNDISFIQV